MTLGNRFTVFIRRAAVVTAFLYTAGYSAVGFVLLFLAALWRLATKRSLPWKSGSLDGPLAAFGAVLVLSAIVSPYIRTAVPVTMALLVSGAVYFGSFRWLLGHDAGAAPLLLHAWGWGVLPTAVVGLADAAATHIRAQIPRGVGPNGLGTTLLLGGVLTLGLGFQSRGWGRAYWVLSALVALVALVSTGSRSSLVGWAVGTVVLIWQELRRRPIWMAAALLLSAALATAVVLTIPQFHGRVGATMRDVSQNRVQIWRTARRMVAARPVLGSGFGTFEQVYNDWKSPQMSSEPFAFNLALNIAVETGVAGLAAAVWIAVTAAVEWIRAGRRLVPVDPLRPTIVALWIGLLVDQLADNTIFSISTSAALWLLLALLVTPSPGVREGAP